MDKKAQRRHYAKLATAMAAVVAGFLLFVEFGVGYLMLQKPLFEPGIFWVSFCMLVLLSWAFEYHMMPSLTDDSHPITLHTKFRRTFASWVSNPPRMPTPVFDDLNPMPGNLPDFNKDKERLQKALEESNEH